MESKSASINVKEVARRSCLPQDNFLDISTQEVAFWMDAISHPPR
jgi:hypothetical protein